MVILLGTRMQFGESEQIASYPLSMLRLEHLLALIVWAAAELAAAALLWSSHEMTGLITAGELVQPSTVAW